MKSILVLFLLVLSTSVFSGEITEFKHELTKTSYFNNDDFQESVERIEKKLLRKAERVCERQDGELTVHSTDADRNTMFGYVNVYLSFNCSND